MWPAVEKASRPLPSDLSIHPSFASSLLHRYPLIRATKLSGSTHKNTSESLDRIGLICGSRLTNPVPLLSVIVSFKIAKCVVFLFKNRLLAFQEYVSFFLYSLCMCDVHDVHIYVWMCEQCVCGWCGEWGLRLAGFICCCLLWRQCRSTEPRHYWRWLV